jgi:hypothetical protein
MLFNFFNCKNAQESKEEDGITFDDFKTMVL